MEKTDRMAVVEGRFRWSDIGSWDAIFDIAPHDATGNAIHGAGVTMDAHNCVIHSDDRLVAVLGAHDLVVVSTADAVLVLPRDRAQDVRELVTKLKSAKRPEATEHRRGHRPWGYYDSSTAATASRSNALWCIPAAPCHCRSTTIAPNIGWSCAAPPK